jgi:hypothetical protein
VDSVEVREQAAAIGTHEDENIPVSEHEFPKENIPTRPDYRGEGHWATPAPDSGIELGFIPIKMYAQVRQDSSEEHRISYSSPNVIRVIKSKMMGRESYVAFMGERRRVYEILVLKS